MTQPMAATEPMASAQAAFLTLLDGRKMTGERMEANNFGHENISKTSVEERVSGVENLRLKDFLPEVYTARQVLELFGVCVRDDRGKKIRSRMRQLRREFGKPDVGLSEGFVAELKALLRVAMHPDYGKYEPEIMSTYVTRDASPMAIERCTEFELALAESLEREPFNPGLKNQEAKDLLDALVPVSIAAIVCGVNVTTIRRWIDAGLAGVWRKGGLAVQKQGAYYFVNAQAAFEWSGRKYGSRGKKTKKSLTNPKKAV